jgi:hypothetical protein
LELVDRAPIAPIVEQPNVAVSSLTATCVTATCVNAGAELLAPQNGLPTICGGCGYPVTLLT